MDRRAFLTALGGTAALAAAGPRASAEPDAWRAGTASVDITPPVGLWMAGYAARTSPSQGVELPLRAKALALADQRGRRVVLVTVDLLGVTARLTAGVAARVHRAHGLRPEALLLNASHTHCGPVVDDQLLVAYDLDERQLAAIRGYTAELEQRLATLAGQAILRLAPARLTFGEGTATFAANRREQFTPLGPVDHTVPVLRVDRVARNAGRDSGPTPDGRPLAVVFGYACHNTTLGADFVRYHGDYAGVAQATLEERHAGTTALFVAGCGADANPKPRHSLALVEAHGRSLADAVERVLPDATPVGGRLTARSGVALLPFAPAPGRDEWLSRLAGENVFERRRAKLMLDRIERDGRLPAAEREPVHVWRIGDLTLVALGGEVVVDYALRLRRERPGRLWVAGYSSDVPGYIPSARVLAEGGYEGGGAMLYYGRPGPFDRTVEERIHRKIEELLG